MLSSRDSGAGILCPASAGILSGGSSFLFSATEGIFQSAPVAHFQDSDPNEPVSNLLALINWGDGTTSPGTIAGGGGVFNVLGSHTYAEEGSYNVAVHASNTGGSQLLINGLGIAADAPLLGASGATLQGTEGQTVNGLVGSFTDANPSGVASDFTAVIHWGDGTASSGTIVSNAGRFQVLGSHVYAEEGSFTTSINVTDTGGASTTVSDTTFIADAPLLPGPFLMPVLNQGAPFNGIVNAFLDFDANGLASDYVAVIDWGDGSQLSTGTISRQRAVCSMSPASIRMRDPVNSRYMSMCSIRVGPWCPLRVSKRSTPFLPIHRNLDRS